LQHRGKETSLPSLFVATEGGEERDPKRDTTTTLILIKEKKRKMLRDAYVDVVQKRVRQAVGTEGWTNLKRKRTWVSVRDKPGDHRKKEREGLFEGRRRRKRAHTFSHCSLGRGRKRGFSEGGVKSFLRGKKGSPLVQHEWGEASHRHGGKECTGRSCTSRGR